MSRLTRRSVRIGKYTIPALLLLALVTGTVSATVYVVLQFTASVTVQANPKVSFYRWGTGTKQNTFTETFNIFPSIKTVDDNATYGIFCDDTASHVCNLRITSITNSANIGTVYVKIVGTAVEITWTGGTLPTSWVQFTAAAGVKYTIWIEVTATSGATVGQTSAITFEMKVENP